MLVSSIHEKGVHSKLGAFVISGIWSTHPGTRQLSPCALRWFSDAHHRACDKDCKKCTCTLGQWSRAASSNPHCNKHAPKWVTQWFVLSRYCHRGYLGTQETIQRVYTSFPYVSIKETHPTSLEERRPDTVLQWYRTVWLEGNMDPNPPVTEHLNIPAWQYPNPCTPCPEHRQQETQWQQLGLPKFLSNNEEIKIVFCTDHYKMLHTFTIKGMKTNTVFSHHPGTRELICKCIFFVFGWLWWRKSK